MKPLFKQELMDKTFNKAISSEYVYRAKVAAALVFRNKKVITISTNVLKSHPLQKIYRKNDYVDHMHAEIHTIVQALRGGFSIHDFAKCTLYVARAKKSASCNEWVYGMACPCRGCLRSVIDFDIAQVYYTTDQHMTSNALFET